MKEKYTVRQEPGINEVLRVTSHLVGINEVKFVYSPLGEMNIDKYRGYSNGP